MGVKGCSFLSVGRRVAVWAQQSPGGKLLGPLEKLCMGSQSPDGHLVRTDLASVANALPYLPLLGHCLPGPLHQHTLEPLHGVQEFSTIDISHSLQKGRLSCKEEAEVVMVT